MMARRPEFFGKQSYSVDLGNQALILTLFGQMTRRGRCPAISRWSLGRARGADVAFTGAQRPGGDGAGDDDGDDE